MRSLSGLAWRISDCFLASNTAIKTRLAGVTDLLEMLRSDEGGGGDGAQEAALIPLVLPLLRDHNAKITQSALEVVELLVRRAPEPTVRAFLKLLWLSLAERLGDSKLPVRQKAVDAVVALSEALDVDAVLEKLKVRRALPTVSRLGGCEHLFVLTGRSCVLLVGLFVFDSRAWRTRTGGRASR